jgi:cytochrome c-type biogenesis protein CcmH
MRNPAPCAIPLSGMTIWFIITVLAACVAALLLGSLLRFKVGPAAGSAEQAVFQDQLAELEQDVAAKKVPAGEAAAIRAEIGRRILAEAQKPASTATRKVSRLTATLLTLPVPLLALLIYGQAGAPDMADTPLSARLQSATQNEDMFAMVRIVELRLQKNPDDARGWTVIAPIYMQMSRFNDAATAYQNQLRLGQPTAELYANLAEALTLANGGIVTTPAAAAAAEGLKLDSAHIKARFFDAVATRQAGRNDEALQKYRKLLAESPADASWRGIVEQEIASMSGAPALTDEQIAAGNALPEGEQRDMITSMVNGLEERLKADGNDLQGWLRLIRARSVLGEVDKAKAALASAKGAVGATPDALAALDALAKELQIQ